MAEELSGGLAIFALSAGIKIAIFLAVLALAYLVDVVSKKKASNYGLNIMAIFFVLAALVEFFHVMTHADVSIFSFLDSHEVTKLIVNGLMIPAGLGLIWWLAGIMKNIRDYR